MCCAEDPGRSDLTTFHPSGSRIDVQSRTGSTRNLTRNRDRGDRRNSAKQCDDIGSPQHPRSWASFPVHAHGSSDAGTPSRQWLVALKRHDRTLSESPGLLGSIVFSVVATLLLALSLRAVASSLGSDRDVQVEVPHEIATMHRVVKIPPASGTDALTIISTIPPRAQNQPTGRPIQARHRRRHDPGPQYRVGTAVHAIVVLLLHFRRPVLLPLVLGALLLTPRSGRRSLAKAPCAARSWRGTDALHRYHQLRSFSLYTLQSQAVAVIDQLPVGAREAGRVLAGKTNSEGVTRVKSKYPDSKPAPVFLVIISPRPHVGGEPANSGLVSQVAVCCLSESVLQAQAH